MKPLDLAKIKGKLNEQHEGAIAFEFLIILVIFAVTIFAVASSPLMDAIKDQVREITDYITNNNNQINELWVK
mgnify:FL=1|jgi:Flp pilus assembly pilin Flp